MKQNINFTLLCLLVVVLAAMIAMTFYYQGKYAELAEAHKDSLSANNNLSKEILLAQKQVQEKEDELNEKIKNLNLSASEVAKFEDINKNLIAETEALDFDMIYEKINKLEYEVDLLENETIMAKLNNEINVLEQEIVNLENQVLEMKAIAESGAE